MLLQEIAECTIPPAWSGKLQGMLERLLTASFKYMGVTELKQVCAVCGLLSTYVQPVTAYSASSLMGCCS
jgi:hypothetical protein